MSIRPNQPMEKETVDPMLAFRQFGPLRRSAFLRAQIACRQTINNAPTSIARMLAFRQFGPLRRSAFLRAQIACQQTINNAPTSIARRALLFDGIYLDDNGEMKFVVRHEDEIRSLTYKEVKETDPRGLCDYLIGKVKFVERKDVPPLPSLAIPLAEQRQQIFRQIADEFGLRFNAFFFNQIEQCFFSLIGNLDVSLTVTIDATLLTAKIVCHAARHSLFAGPPIQPEVTFLWPLTDWNQFLWSVRGIFSKFFFGLRCDRTTKYLAIDGARPMEESPIIPVVEQPEDDDDNDGARGSGQIEDPRRFSVAVPHRDLPLEKIADDLMLRLVRVPGKRVQFSPNEQKQTKENNNFLYFEDLNLSQDERAWIHVVQGNKHNEIKKEHWLKVNRQLLTYAIMGKCLTVFK